MTDWIDVAPEGTLEPGEHKVIDVDDRMVAVFNIGGEFLAIEDLCTHDGEELTGGPLEGDQIICPRHGAAFCLRTGRALTPPAYEDVDTFAVRVQDGMVQVEDPDVDAGG